jgi:hypothetical protein
LLIQKEKAFWISSEISKIMEFIQGGLEAYPERSSANFFMRASSVVGFNPKISAAPPFPRMRHLVRLSTFKICARYAS